MKTTVQITGISPRKEGIASKSGRAYAFTPVSMIFDWPGVNGQKAVTVNIDDDVLGSRVLHPGDLVDCYINENFYLRRFEITDFC